MVRFDLKKYLLFVLLSSTTLFGTEWVKVDGTSANDGFSLNAIAMDSVENIYSTGFTLGSIDGANAGSSDVFLVKHNSLGSKVWARQLGTNEGDYGEGVTVDSSGNVYVVGQTYAGLDGQSHYGLNDGFVIKYDSSGNKQWVKQFGTISFDEFQDVVIDSLGNIYIAGKTFGDMFGQVDGTGDDFDFIIIKLDSSGNQVWGKQLGTHEEDIAFGIDTDSYGNVYIAGYVSADYTGVHHGWNDGFITKFDSSGNEIWKKQFGSIGDMNDRVFSIKVKYDHIYIAAYAQGTISGQTSVGQDDAFVAKYDLNGNELWLKQFGTNENDQAFDIDVDFLGNVYVTGQTFGNLTGGTDDTYNGVFVRKYSSSGDVKWTKHYGGGNYEQGRGIVLDSKGNIYVNGYTESNNFGGQAGKGGQDYFLLRIDTDTPTNITVSASTVAENGTENVGTLSTTDATIGRGSDNHTYSLCGGTDDSLFSISSNTLQLTTPVDFETKNSLSVCVRTTDSENLTFDKNLTITVTDENDNPTDMFLGGYTIMENSASGTSVGVISTIDPDSGDTFTYSLDCSTPSADDTNFTIAGNILQTNASFDFETKNSLFVCVKTTDSGGGTFEKSFTITVLNDTSDDSPAISTASLDLTDYNLTRVVFEQPLSSSGILSKFQQDLNDGNITIRNSFTNSKVALKFESNKSQEAFISVKNASDILEVRGFSYYNLVLTVQDSAFNNSNKEENLSLTKTLGTLDVENEAWNLITIPQGLHTNSREFIKANKVSKIWGWEINSSDEYDWVAYPKRMESGRGYWVKTRTANNTGGSLGNVNATDFNPTVFGDVNSSLEINTSNLIEVVLEMPRKDEWVLLGNAGAEATIHLNSGAENDSSIYYFEDLLNTKENCYFVSIYHWDTTSEKWIHDSVNNAVIPSGSGIWVKQRLCDQ
jgi:hypothetical protein